MKINLRCTQCGDPYPVALEDLCEVWKQGYAGLCGESKEDVEVATEIRCFCGNTDTFDSPMYLHLFQVAFEELVLNKK